MQKLRNKRNKYRINW